VKKRAKGEYHALPPKMKSRVSGGPRREKKGGVQGSYEMVVGSEDSRLIHTQKKTKGGEREVAPSDLNPRRGKSLTVKKEKKNHQGYLRPTGSNPLSWLSGRISGKGTLVGQMELDW